MQNLCHSLSSNSSLFASNLRICNNQRSKKSHLYSALHQILDVCNSNTRIRISLEVNIPWNLLPVMMITELTQHSGIFVGVIEIGYGGDAIATTHFSSGKSSMKTGSFSRTLTISSVVPIIINFWPSFTPKVAQSASSLNRPPFDHNLIPFWRYSC